MDTWDYYNHAAISSVAPHQEPDLSVVQSGKIWSMPGKPILARWTSDWDCGYETQWWYVIKDSPFDILALKSKRRYEINKGNRFFEVRIINPVVYIDDLFRITIDAYTSWPEKYRPTVEKKQFKERAITWKDKVVFGAFSSDDKKLYGYALLYDKGTYLEFRELRVTPEQEKNAINAAIVNGILESYAERFVDGFYIVDGARSIRHETAFQDYLEKYFGFRKAYCTLHVAYCNWMKMVVNVLYPFRDRISTSTGLGSSIKSILVMEEICRSFKEDIKK